jgi:hypothetical protein
MFARPALEEGSNHSDNGAYKNVAPLPNPPVKGHWNGDICGAHNR